MGQTENLPPPAGGKSDSKPKRSATSNMADSVARADPRLPAGSRYCRCAECGCYFGGADGFGRHRARFACVSPADLAMVMDSRGYWRRSGPRKGFFHGALAQPADFGAAPVHG